MPTAATAAPLAAADAQPDQPEITVLHRDYFDAILPEPYRILGLTLRPLSIGRYRLMKRFEVAFVAEGEATAGIGDLLLGILICSMRCDEFLEFYNSPDFTTEIKRWAKAIDARAPFEGRPLLHLAWNFFFGKRWRANHGFNVLEKMKLFISYIEEGSKVPHFLDESDSQNASGAHWSQSIEAVMREFQGWTREEINEESLNKALLDYYKHMENQGLGRLMTAEEVKDMETPLTPEQSAEVMATWERIRQFKGLDPLPDTNPPPTSS